MVEKKIKALVDFQFTNFTGTHFLVAGEVKRIRFINHQRFEQHVQAGHMVEAGLHEKEDKTIPVVFPPVNEEETVVSVDPVDPIDPSEGIEPDKLDLPCPSEDRPVEEKERELTEAEEAVLAEAKPETEAEAIAALESAEVPEELTPEQETEGQSEVEEFEPNKETIEAIEETERGEGLHPVDTVEELMEELNEEGGDVPELTS